MFEIIKTNRFKRDIEKYKYNTKVEERLKDAFYCFMEGKSLPNSFNDHSLKGDYLGYRECHVFPNILLIYKINDDNKTITLSYLGSHSDLFG